MDLTEQKKINPAQFKRHPWETVRLKILLFFLAKKKSKKFIVDIGSGDAYIATQLSKQFQDYKIAAVDTNYDEQFIKNNETENLTFLKNIGDIPAKKSIDVLLTMDVLEHIEKPEALLVEIKNLSNLSFSTQLIITVPSFQFLFNEHDIFLKHFRRYNRHQLIQLLCDNNFHIQYTGYFFFSLFLTRCIQKLLGSKQTLGVHNWSGGNFVTSLMTNILWIDFKICWYLSRIGIHLPGLSCYCICHPLPS